MRLLPLVIVAFLISSCAEAQVKVQDFTEDTAPGASDFAYSTKYISPSYSPRKAKWSNVVKLSGWQKSGTTISTVTAGDNVTTTGTITGGYIVGDGSGLTNVAGASTTPGGTGTQVQYRGGSSTLSGLSGSSVSGSTLTVGTLVGTSDVKVNSLSVCLSDGTHCPSAGSESDPVVKALTGIIKSNGSAISAVTAPSGTIVGTSDSQTLTNKTLTTPIISSISNTGTITLPTSTDTLVGKATTDTLTNKTLTSPTISAPTITGAITATSATSFNIPNSAAPTLSVFGDLAGDNNIWASGRGAPLFFDGTANTVLVGTLASDTPTNGQVPTWNTGGTITWETPSGGGGSITAADTLVIYSDGANNPVGDSDFTWNKTTNVLTVGSLTTATTNTPKVEYFPTQTSDTHYVTGVSGDGGNDDDDAWVISKGSVLGTGNVLSIASTGAITIPGALTVTGHSTLEGVTSSGATGTGSIVFGTSPTITTPKIITSLNDTNGNSLIKVTATSSAVNQITVANAASGSGPTISTTGSGTDIDLNLSPKGAGNVVITGSGALNINTTSNAFSLGADGSTYFATDGDTNGNLTIGVGDGDRITVTNAGEVAIGSISSDGTGKIVCIKSDGKLGTCSGAYSSGVCTCG